MQHNSGNNSRCFFLITRKIKNKNKKNSRMLSISKDFILIVLECITLNFTNQMYTVNQSYELILLRILGQAHRVPFNILSFGDFS